MAISTLLIAVQTASIVSPENPPVTLREKLPIRMLIRITIAENHPAFAILSLIPKDVESQPQIPIGNLRKDHFLLGFHGLHPLRNRQCLHRS